MSEGSESSRATQTRVVQVPVDLVELESRLVAVERRVQAQEARDQRLLALIDAVLRLTEALAPVLEAVRPALDLQPLGGLGDYFGTGGPGPPAHPVSPEPPPPSPATPEPPEPSSASPPEPSSPEQPSAFSVHAWRSNTVLRAAIAAPAPAAVVTPERLAAAQSRMRESAPEQVVNGAQGAASSAETAAVVQASPEIGPPSGTPAAEVQPLPAQRIDGPAVESPPSAVRPPGRRSWIRRALRHMAKDDPEAAGRLLVGLLPAHRLAEIEPLDQLPGPPAKVAKVVVRGRFRRRLGWEMSDLDGDLATVTALARLARLRGSFIQLHFAGVRLDPQLTFALVAQTIKPRWTAGHRFTVCHQGSGSTYLYVRDGILPLATITPPAGEVTTTLRCDDHELMALLAGDEPQNLVVQGDDSLLQLLSEWLARATVA